MSDTAQALALKAEPKETQTFAQLLERQRPAIELALPQAIGAERFARIALTEIRRNPLLQACDPYSVLGALMLCAQLGLEPGPLGHAYLVPFAKECTFILGYKGMLELAGRSDRLGSIQAAAVYEGDEFQFYRTETGPKLRHVDAHPSERGGTLCYYASATVRVGPRNFAARAVRLWPDEIEAAKKRSPAGRKDAGPWHTDYEAMALKTCVRRLSRWLPMTAVLAQALDSDERVVKDLDVSGEVELEAREETSDAG